MLTGNKEMIARSVATTSSSHVESSDEVTLNRISADVASSRLARVMRIEWLGQTLASLCWIGSVLAYGISASGDWLQLLAASSWLVANIAAAMTGEAD